MPLNERTFSDTKSPLIGDLDTSPTTDSQTKEDISLIRGCTNPTATNYNPTATVDNGLCVFPVEDDVEPLPYYDVDKPIPDTVDLTNPIIGNPIQISFTSTPNNAAVLMDGIDTLVATPGKIIFNEKELITPKIFTIQIPGYTSKSVYRLRSIPKTSIFIAYFGFGKSYILQVEKLVDGVWSIDSGLTLQLTSSSIKYITLNFDIQKDYVPLPIPVLNKHRVLIRGDVSGNQIIKYITSKGESGFVTNDTELDITIVADLDDRLPWIEFQRVGISKFTHKVVYSILEPSSNKPTTTEDDFRKVLNTGTTIIEVSANKLTDFPALDTPIVNVDNDMLQYNINQRLPISINYYSEFTDEVRYALGNTTRTLSPNGTLELYERDFPSGIGNYTLYLQPVSNINGTGNLKKILIQVLSKEFLPGPDITHITYPENIKGADFRGFNEDFKISWQSINTNYIEIYVNKYDSEFSVAKVENNGTLTLNVSKLLNKGKIRYGNNTDKVKIPLVFIPFNTEGNEVTQGKEEQITILFDKGDLTLRRAQVISDIKIAFETQLDDGILEQETSKYLTHYVHFGNAVDKLISTWAIDTETFSEYVEDPDTSQLRKVKSVNTLVLKLYEPLPNSIQPSSVVWMSKLQSIPIINQVIINDEDISECVLLTPNFELDVGDDIGYQILDDLVASGSVSSAEVIQEYIGTNAFSLEKLNLEYIDETDYLWDNFVKYSSAEERSENFFYKVKAIQYHEATLNNLASGSATTGSIEKSNEIKRVNASIHNLKKGFDSFENTLYNESGSLTYPGAGTSELSSSSSPEAQSWYNGIIASSQDFDEFNDNALINNIPLHIKDDTEGQDYVLFFNMVGQHFDVLTSYTQGILDGKKLTNKNDDGITNELIYHMLESLGWDADMGVKSQYLWEYAFGKAEDGTQISELSGKDRQRQIWRRLINNLPYLYKHKGTKRALHAAMACYGIPSSMLTVMEFGGPVDTTTGGTTSFTYDDRTAALSFTNNTENLTIPWKIYNSGSVPNTIEMRVLTDNRVEQTLIDSPFLQVLILPGTGSQAAIQLKLLGDGLSFTSSYFPMFNDDYTQIAITQTLTGSDWIYEIFGKEGYNERIRNEGYGSLIVATGSTISWKQEDDLEFGTSFIGSIDEFRLWSTPLEESRIENHALIPDAIDGNHVSASSEDLILRMDFEYPKDRNADTQIKNVSINLGYEEPYITANNFPSNTTYPYQYIPYERSVTAIVPATGINFSNKIRFENQTLENYVKFGSLTNVTSFDNAKDSNKLGLFFSPIKEVNMDILKSLGQFNIDNYIGNPADDYNYEYKELNQLRNYYFKRYNLNIYEYIQLVRYIDQTIFTTLESLVPGRAKVSSGLLIEQHILERSKIERTKPTGEDLDHEADINVDETTNIFGETSRYQGDIDAADDVDVKMDTENLIGIVDAKDEEQLSGDPAFWSGLISVDEDEILTGTYPTWDATIDAEVTGSIQGQYDSTKYTVVGMDRDSLYNAGFGVTGENSHSIKTYLDVWGNMQKERVQIYRLKQQYTEEIPENINYNDPSLGTHYVEQTLHKYTITTLPYGGSAPVVGNDIVEVIPLNGYFSSHYRNVGDLTTGLKNAFYNGSKQTSSTTLDGGSPIESWTTNPNVLKVNDSGRGSGEPVLIVD